MGGTKTGGARGRPPIPAHLHVLNGNPSKIPDLNRRLAAEPKPTPVAPKVPAWLKKDRIAHAEWKRVVPELERLGLLTCVDGAALEAYCKTYSRWREAEEAMDKAKATVYETHNKNGSPYRQAVPEIGIAQKYLMLCKGYISEFGLSPSARARMAIPGQDDNDDEMESILRKTK